MSQSPSPDLRACLRPAAWPEADRAAWEQAVAPRRGPFRKNQGGRGPNAASLSKLASGYGRWLGFLRQAGELDEREAPAVRVTPERLDAYFEHLRGCGNADYTVVSRFDELRGALQLLCAGMDFRWISRPQGISLRLRLPMRRRNRFVPDSAALLTWAEELFQAGIAQPKPRARCAQVREAVMIAILTTQAPRLRALAALRVGLHLQRRGDTWVLDQLPEITKTGNDLTMPLPAEVTVMLERYLAVERRDLMRGQAHDALWVAWGGEALAEATISRRIRLRSLERFGVAFGPHRFRASLATTLALESPETPLDASVILGHTGPEVTLAHYNRASAIAAARRHAERLAKLRR